MFQQHSRLSNSDDDSGCALEEYAWCPPGLKAEQVCFDIYISIFIFFVRLGSTILQMFSRRQSPVSQFNWRKISNENARRTTASARFRSEILSFVDWRRKKWIENFQRTTTTQRTRSWFGTTIALNTIANAMSRSMNFTRQDNDWHFRTSLLFRLVSKINRFRLDMCIRRTSRSNRSLASSMF
mgnify:CR=1 FL=1